MPGAGHSLGGSPHRRILCGGGLQLDQAPFGHRRSADVHRILPPPFAHAGGTGGNRPSDSLGEGIPCFASRSTHRRRRYAYPCPPAEIPLPRDHALFKVPLFVRDRERVLHSLARRGLELDYIYDPPLDLYATEELTVRIPSRAEALWWSRDVLPVSPLQADRFLCLLREIPPLLSLEA